MDNHAAQEAWFATHAIRTLPRIFDSAMHAYAWKDVLSQLGACIDAKGSTGTTLEGRVRVFHGLGAKRGPSLCR
eukprot:4538339-Karenia_brevis.AAC.1